jgi:serine phosphatase RsbU (regulator of sigma subunit)
VAEKAANREHQLRTEKELADVRAFQQSLLPPACGTVGGLWVVAQYSPCTELAGDFYGYAAFEPDGVAILVADVAGHGASAAMLTGNVKSAFDFASADRYEPIPLEREIGFREPALVKVQAVLICGGTLKLGIGHR